MSYGRRTLLTPSAILLLSQLTNTYGLGQLTEERAPGLCPLVMAVLSPVVGAGHQDHAVFMLQAVGGGQHYFAACKDKM